MCHVSSKIALIARLLYLVCLQKFYDLSAQYSVSWDHVAVRDSDGMTVTHITRLLVLTAG